MARGESAFKLYSASPAVKLSSGERGSDVTGNAVLSVVMYRKHGILPKRHYIAHPAHLRTYHHIHTFTHIYLAAGKTHLNRPALRLLPSIYVRGEGGNAVLGNAAPSVIKSQKTRHSCQHDITSLTPQVLYAYIYTQKCAYVLQFSVPISEIFVGDMPL